MYVCIYIYIYIYILHIYLYIYIIYIYLYLYISCLCNVLLQNPVVLPRFFKSVLILRSENTGCGSVTRGHVKSSQNRNEAPLQAQRLFLYAGTGIFLFFRSQIHQCFLRCASSL